MQKTYNIIGNFKYFVIIPIVVIITGIVFNIFNGVNLSIDFKGGSTITYSYEGELDTEKFIEATENAIKSSGNETTLIYNYSGELESTNVKTALEGVSVDGIEFSTENGTSDGKSYIYIYAIGDKLLSDDNINTVTSTLQSNFSSNKVTFDSKETDPYVETKVEVVDGEDLTSGTKNITTNVIGNATLTTEQLDKIKTTVVEEFSDNNIKSTGSTTVSANFGSLFFGKALYSIVIASILIIIYVGYRFRTVGGVKAAMSALIALIHDLLFIYFVDVIFGITIDTNFIAVFLTILGYSLNDTIVIYDRIRENKDLYGNKKTIREITNMSISQSLRRTCITSLTTFSAIATVAVVAMIKNLDSILTFAIPMSIGTICGTFSSLVIAGPIYVFWCERSEKKNNKSSAYVNRKSSKGKRKKSY